MLDSIKREVTRHLMAVQVRSQEEVEEAERRAEQAARALKNVQYQHADFQPGVADDEAEQISPDGVPAAVPHAGAVAAAMAGAEPFVRSTQKVGRNDPCPCGSGKKFKQCHGRLA
jgi:preprotein translocase subunit SecA